MEGKLPDQKYTRNLPAIMSKGALVIFDLGYWAFDTLFDILQKGSFFLSRLNTRVQLWEKNGDTYTAVDLVKTLKNCTEQGIEVELYLNKGDKFIKVRLVGYRVPEETANIRRMKARRNSQKKGHTASERTLFHCNWSLFITNADTEKLPGKMLRTLYRLRWNVELIFKSWKSILRMHKTNVRKNDHRIKCELYAKLILATIVHRIHHHLNSYMWNSLKRELSLDKLWKYIQVRIETLYKKMLQGSDEFTAYINSLLENIIVVCEKKHQKKRKTTLQLIDEMIGDAQPLKKGIELKYLEKFKLA
jgi:IS4 transposase